MIGNKLEQEIISLYSKDFSSFYSINQIALRLGKKYPYINKKVTSLVKQKIFKKTIIGRSHICSLNLDNEETVYLMILNELQKKQQAIKDDSQLKDAVDYLDKIRKYLSLQLALKVDDTIIFVFNDKEEIFQFEKSIMKSVFLNMKITVFLRDDFLKELLRNRGLHEDHIILYGYERYFEYLKEVENELKMKFSKLLP